MVKVSVLMAVYDTHFVYVKRAIDSVLKQDFQDFELIIIDDGSCFEKSEAILGYVAKHENKIAISDENELDYEEEDQNLSNELSINRRNEIVIYRVPNHCWIKRLILFYY